MPFYLGLPSDHTRLSNIGSNSHAQIDSKLGYALSLFQAAAGSPADTLTYYIGQIAALVTTQGLQRVMIPFGGTIVSIRGNFFQAAGSNEASTLSLLHNGVNETVISNALDHSAAVTPFSKTDISQAVVAGDYIELKWVAPTWFTNPTSVRLASTVWVQT